MAGNGNLVEVSWKDISTNQRDFTSYYRPYLFSYSSEFQDFSQNLTKNIINNKQSNSEIIKILDIVKKQIETITKYCNEVYDALDIKERDQFIYSQGGTIIKFDGANKMAELFRRQSSSSWIETSEGSGIYKHNPRSLIQEIISIIASVNYQSLIQSKVDNRVLKNPKRLIKPTYYERMRKLFATKMPGYSLPERGDVQDLTVTGIINLIKGVFNNSTLSSVPKVLINIIAEKTTRDAEVTKKTDSSSFLANSSYDYINQGIAQIMLDQLKTTSMKGVYPQLQRIFKNRDKRISCSDFERIFIDFMDRQLQDYQGKNMRRTSQEQKDNTPIARELSGMTLELSIPFGLLIEKIVSPNSIFQKIDLKNVGRQKEEGRTGESGTDFMMTIKKSNGQSIKVRIQAKNVRISEYDLNKKRTIYIGSEKNLLDFAKESLPTEYAENLVFLLTNFYFLSQGDVLNEKITYSSLNKDTVKYLQFLINQTTLYLAGGKMPIFKDYINNLYNKINSLNNLNDNEYYDLTNLNLFYIYSNRYFFPISVFLIPVINFLDYLLNGQSSLTGAYGTDIHFKLSEGADYGQEKEEFDNFLNQDINLVNKQNLLSFKTDPRNNSYNILTSSKSSGEYLLSQLKMSKFNFQLNLKSLNQILGL